MQDINAAKADWAGGPRDRPPKEGETAMRQQIAAQRGRQRRYQQDMEMEREDVPQPPRAAMQEMFDDVKDNSRHHTRGSGPADASMRPSSKAPMPAGTRDRGAPHPNSGPYETGVPSRIGLPGRGGKPKRLSGTEKEQDHERTSKSKLDLLDVLTHPQRSGSRAAQAVYDDEEAQLRAEFCRHHIGSNSLSVSPSDSPRDGGDRKGRSGPAAGSSNQGDRSQTDHIQGDRRPLATRRPGWDDDDGDDDDEDDDDKSPKGWDSGPYDEADEEEEEDEEEDDQGPGSGREEA